MVVDTSGSWTVLQTSAWNAAQQQFQIYQIAGIILLLLIIAICVMFKDAFPFIWARFVTHEVVVGILDATTHRITPNRDFKKRANMFYYKGEPLPFVKCYKGNFLFTGLPFDILDVNMDVITDPRYRKACSELKKMGYPNIDALEKAILFSQMSADDPRVAEIIYREGYKDYEDAWARINPSDLTIESPIVKQFFVAMPLEELIGYGSHVPSEDILGEVDDVYESRKPSMQFKRDMEKILPMCIIVFLAAVILVVAYVVFFKGH